MGLLAFTKKHFYSPEMHAAPKIAKFCNFVIFVEFAFFVKLFFFFFVPLALKSLCLAVCNQICKFLRALLNLQFW